MGSLSDAVYQRTINDFESSKKRTKIKKFLGVSAGVAVVLGMSVGVVNLVNASHDFHNSHQARLQYMSKTPFVLDGGTVDGCKIQYIATAHETANGAFEKANYMKSDCDGNVYINKIKEKIIFNRSKLLNDEKDLNKLLNIK